MSHGGMAEMILSYVLFDQNVVISIFRYFINSFHGNQLFYKYQNTFEMKVQGRFLTCKWLLQF